jgi:hypothetical protein
VIDELQNTLGCEKVSTAETEAETILKECFWYSPVLKKCLESRRASSGVEDCFRVGTEGCACDRLPQRSAGHGAAARRVATSFTQGQT